MNSPLPKDPVVLNNLFVQAGLGITKDMDEQLEQMYSPEQLYMNQLMSTPTEQDQPQENNANLPQNDMGGGPVDNFSNQTMGTPPQSDEIYNSMIQSTRGDFQNNFKQSNKSQHWRQGDYVG